MSVTPFTPRQLTEDQVCEACPLPDQCMLKGRCDYESFMTNTYADPAETERNVVAMKKKEKGA